MIDWRTLVKRIILIWMVVLVSIGAISMFSGDDSESPPSTTTIQQKWGCEEDEVVYFSDPIECVSEEEDIRRQRG